MLGVVLTRFGGVDCFSAQELPETAPAAHEIRIGVRAIGFNPVDVAMRRGQLGGAPPMVIGRDVSGVVEAVGDSVTRFAVGDHVYARNTGAYAESVVVPSALVAHKPRSLSFAQAAAFPVAGLTAYQCLEKANVQPGQPVLVAGASGGVGSIATQLLRHRGASPIIATAGSAASAEYLIQTLGVPPEGVLRYDGRSLDELAAEVMRMAGGRFVQAAFDFVGERMKRLCFAVVGVDGHVVTIVEERPGFELDVWDEHTSPLVLRSASLHFVQLAARLAYAPEETWPIYGRQLETLARMIDAGHIAPVAITDVGPFSLEAVRRAHTLLEGRHVQGKLIATVA
ncbi:quinone oxidoreductase family protein [Polyangium aurulentum]|uniref:quinone oxidoreductase family protein n=1 Tax=Polyangium aurulentum TaxID=2567896 RepID=UPI0010AE1697|nr:NADP-dependent oxidoreductase [Polyangium aurulentum]UQA59799.1 NADP-dependent oxidoreductase [Polyangium aurulentum]